MSKGNKNGVPHSNSSKRAPKAQYAQRHKFFSKPQTQKPEINKVSETGLSEALTGVLALNCIAQLRY